MGLKNGRVRCDGTGIFVDLFAGCGGMTLGLMEAGWQGLFGIEIQQDAFETYRQNFLASGKHSLVWPNWLEKRPWDIKLLLKAHAAELQSLRGSVDLVCGGPPCQGFSYSGRRNSRDPRNQLFRRYVDFVNLVQPKFLIVENVPGFSVSHGKKNRPKTARNTQSYAERLQDLLRPSYWLDACIVRATRFGVPQTRDRIFVVGVRRDAKAMPDSGWAASLLENVREEFLQSKNLPSREITAKKAIGDLEITGRRLISYQSDVSCRTRLSFQQVEYKPPPKPNAYLRLMRNGSNGQPPSCLRLPRHRTDIVRRFRYIHKWFSKGRRLTDPEREILGVAKHRIVPMSADRPAHTLTTIPDDLLHYSEPRVLTVRECARLQSFPDWFDFHGKYTTGGTRRAKECPRYTQVGNAVPPLVAEAWGLAFHELARTSRGK